MCVCLCISMRFKVKEGLVKIKAKPTHNLQNFIIIDWNRNRKRKSHLKHLDFDSNCFM